MIPPNSIPQQDTLVSSLVAQLVIVAQQIQGIGNCYPEVPEQPPEDGSVLFAPLSIRVNDSATSGKVVLLFDFELLHLFRRSRLQQNLASISAAIPAWISVLTAWSNVTLQGTVETIILSAMDIVPYKHGQQDYLALKMTVTARPILNINMS